MMCRFDNLIIEHSKNYPNTEFLIEEIDSIKKILSKIISTAKSKK
jgi:hypothetical protein